MEDMLNDNTQEQQHRSSSFSDERQQKLFQQHNTKRASEGAILDFVDSSTPEAYRRTNQINKTEQFTHPTITQQHRSFNDLTNKTSNKGKEDIHQIKSNFSMILF
jgi:hypothetical protein